MGSIYTTLANAANFATAMIALGISFLLLHRVLGPRIRRLRTVELAPGLYHFKDGKVEDGGLLWRPVEVLFR